ncbi:hypothetical protein F4861DRAFT_91637 [Xylaria intraflava]|nr:hypothetical protein F4861DRAFT_91637 [Xylaria intraflava]
MMTPIIDSPLYLDPVGAIQASGSPLNSLSSSSYEKPLPRPPRSPAHAAQIRVRNRRREWLSRHPSYFRSLEHELADPVLYDALIRRFQSHEEREKEGRAKGFARVLEVDLLRGEARLSELADGTSRGAHGRENMSAASNGFSAMVEPVDNHVLRSSRPRSPAGTFRQPEPGSASEPDVEIAGLATLEVQDLEPQSVPQTAEEGRTRWDEFLQHRFVAGGDEDFNYRIVDEDDEYDALERREQEDAWFDNEEPGWVGESGDDDEAEQQESGDKVVIERTLTGETGVQDF